MELLLPKSGRYVVAVSGGVDSIAMLDLLSKQPELELVVAHFDHGIRTDSDQDRQFVERLAKKYQLPFVFKRAELGANASEALAREERYNFLRQTMQKHEAEAIITAHHQDDLLETAVINMLRGTGRKGLTALSSHQKLARPLLKVTKQELISYAHNHQLEWREDSTNQDDRYLRNYVRHHILGRFTPAQRQHLLDIVYKTQITNQELDNLLDKYIASEHISRKEFNMLPHAVAKEVMAARLRNAGLRDFDGKTLERLVIGSKVAQASTTIDAGRGFSFIVQKESLALKRAER